MTEKVSGLVDQIPHHNEDSGWSIIRILPAEDYPHAQDYDGTVTVVGVMPRFREGESVEFAGEWSNSRRYGMQFEASAAILRLPKTEKEILDYLGSRSVKGIGPDGAALIVDRFGEATIEVLDEEPDQLYEIPGLKPAVVDLFLKDWSENHVQRHSMIFLQAELGISGRLARRIYSKYGVDTRRLVRTKPYQLAVDEFVSFKKADSIAKKLGVLDHHRVRLQGGLLQAMHDFASDGHTFAPRAGALARAAKFLRCENDGKLGAALSDLLNSKQLGEELLDGEDGAKPIRAIYLPSYWQAENAVAETLAAMATIPGRLIKRENDEDLLSLIIKHFHRNGFQKPVSEQIGAVQSSLTNKVSVLTGGPGTGKTATLRILASVLRERGYAFKLAAPTGRAARRLASATGNDASTIHRLLKWNHDTGGFTFHEGNQLAVDIVVIDEVSMLDLLLFDSLLKALPLKAHLLLVGDVDQLPSVGAGNVLRDVIGSGIAKLTRLRQIHRQDESSRIVSNANDINQGRMPIIDNQASDFFFFNIQDPEKVADNIVEIVKTKIPERWGFDSLRDIQVIAPMRKGLIGKNNLNSCLQMALNGLSGTPVKVGGKALRVGDKVMQTRNDYDKDVFNGDIGFIQSIDFENKTLKIKFEDGDLSKPRAQVPESAESSDLEEFLTPLPGSDHITYNFSDIRDLELAYCITIHKSQGSEFPVVVMPIHSQHSWMF